MFEMSHDMFSPACVIINLQVISMMYLLPLCGLLCLLNGQIISGETIENYMHRRNDAKEKQRKAGTGGTVTLNTKERIMNEFLMDLKLKELYYYKANNDGQDFQPANHFLRVKEDIEKSDVFKIIKMMPKGWFIYSLRTVTWYWCMMCLLIFRLPSRIHVYKTSWP